MYLDMAMDIPQRTRSLGRPSRRTGPPASCLLGELLEGFTANEELNGYKCPNCSKDTGCFKQYSIKSLPNVRLDKLLNFTVY